MNHSTTAWKPLFSVMKFYTFRNEFTPFVMSPIFHSVMKFYFLRHESAHFFIMKSYPATTSWRLDWWVLHRFTHLAVLQSPQTQHGGVQGLSLFIQSWLQTEFLLVLRIVTPVSVARTGSGICRQIVQFRTFCGGLTSRAGRVAGGRISITNYLEDRDWILFKSNAQLVRSCCRLPSCPPPRDGGNNPLRPVRQPELVQFYYESTQFHHAST